MTASETERAVIFVRGRVQRVGFRWWTRARALELGLVGYARNLADGRVEVCAQGPRDRIERLMTMLDPASTGNARPGHVTGLMTQWLASKPTLQGFQER